MGEEEREDLIELVSEDGKEMKFEYLATIDMFEGEYVVLLPFEEDAAADQDVDEVVILKVERIKKSEAVYPGKVTESDEAGVSEQVGTTSSEEVQNVSGLEGTLEEVGEETSAKKLEEDDDDDEEEIFVSVDDETELNSVFEEFKKRIREQYGSGTTTGTESI